MSKSCCCDCCCCSSRCCDCLTFLLWGFCPSRKCCCKCDCSNKKGPHCPPHRRFDDGVKEEWEGGWGMRRDGNRRNKFEGNIANSVLRGNEDNIIEASFSERFSEQNFDNSRRPFSREQTSLAYITTSGLVNGFDVPAGGRIPLTTLRVNDDNIITLNDNTIRFNRPGLYKIDFVIATFSNNPGAVEQIAIGFRRITEAQTIFTAGMRLSTQSNLIVGTGAFRVNETRSLYELINLNETPIRLESYTGETVLTASNVVNMTITYLSD